MESGNVIAAALAESLDKPICWSQWAFHMPNIGIKKALEINRGPFLLGIANIVLTIRFSGDQQPNMHLEVVPVRKSGMSRRI